VSWDKHIDLAIHQKPCYRTDAVHSGGLLGKEIKWENCDQEESNSERLKLIKPIILLELLERTNMDQILIFVRTNLDADLLENFLDSKAKESSKMLANCFSCKVLAGKRSMEERQKNLKAFKDGDVRILVATDVAARGIDVPELPVCINYTLPDSVSTYIHRVGRVGRNGRKGIAISIVAEEGIKEKVWYCQTGNTPPCTDCRVFEDGGNAF
jgi:ATP-dependent RNA helicase DDX1